MAGGWQFQGEIPASDEGLDRLRESIERLLMSSDVQYGVRFDNEWAGGEFAYSWAAIWSEN